MTPMQLYAVIQTAIVIAAMGALGVSRFGMLQKKRERAFALLGFFFLFGVPVLMALDIMGPR